MKKKLLTLCLVVVLAFTAIIGTTLAYFTDTDTETNIIGTGVATDGKVKIELVEQERRFDNEGELIGLGEFTDAKSLLPIVGSAQDAKDKYGMPIAANYVDKIINVKNLAEDAYVRVYIAVPAELDDVGDAGKNVLLWNWGDKFDPNGAKTSETANDKHSDYSDFWGVETFVASDVLIEDVKCNVYSYTYQKALETDATTNYAAVVGFYLDSKVNYDNDKECYTINGTALTTDLSQIKIPVYAIGVQAAGFDTADAALTAGFGENYNPWAE